MKKILPNFLATTLNKTTLNKRFFLADYLYLQIISINNKLLFIHCITYNIIIKKLNIKIFLLPSPYDLK